MTADDVRNLLTKKCDAAGSQLAWALAHEVAPSYITGVLNGDIEPAGKMLKALGLERVVTYRKIPTKQKELSSGKKRKIQSAEGHEGQGPKGQSRKAGRPGD